ALRDGKITVTRAHREAVGFAHRLAGDDLDRQVELPGHLAHQHELLEVLLAEHRRHRLHRVEELEHDGGDTVEESRAELSLELVGEARRLDEEGLRLRIEHALVRREEQLHARLLEERAVALEGPRIALEVLARRELQAVHEDAHRDRAAVPSREPREREVALVQVPHRRHEGHRAGGGDRGAQRGDVAYDAHQPRLKNSRRLFMPRTRDTSSSKSGSRSTKLRFSEFTVRTGAAV